MASPGVLSKDDIQRLMTDRSIQAQIQIVEKLTDQYTSSGPGAFSPEQAAIANDIFQLLLARAGTIVRAMLAMQLSQTDKLPPDLARKMANDVDEVAGPVLQYSEVLSDKDLMDIVGSLVDSAKLESIAKRSNVSEAVSDALLNTNVETVANTLVQNEGANITEKSFEKIAERYRDNPEVMESLIQRSSVPAGIVDKVVEQVSSTVRQRLEQKYGNLAEMKAMRKTLDQSMELARIKMMGFKSSDKELSRLIRALSDSNTLSPFSALAIGSVQLFEISLSRLLHIRVDNVHILLKDPIGFKTVYERAQLPAPLLEAVALAVRAIREIEEEQVQKTGHKKEVSAAQMMERMRLLSKGKKIEGVDHLFAMMQHLAQ